MVLRKAPLKNPYRNSARAFAGITKRNRYNKVLFSIPCPTVHGWIIRTLLLNHKGIDTVRERERERERKRESLKGSFKLIDAVMAIRIDLGFKT